MNVFGDLVMILDNDYVNYGSVVVVVLILVSVAVNVYKLFGVVVGLMCVVGIFLVMNYIVDDVFILVMIVINVVGVIGGFYLVMLFIMDKFGILFFFVGGALVVVGVFFVIFVVGGVIECVDMVLVVCNWVVLLVVGGFVKVVVKYVLDIWVFVVGTKVNVVASVGAYSFDFFNYSNYIVIGVVLFFVYMGICI